MAVAIPTVIVAGPLFGKLAGRRVVLEAPDRFSSAGSGPADEVSRDEFDNKLRRPRFGITLATVLLPVVLMMGKALVNIFIDDEGQLVRVVSTFWVRRW